VVGDLLAGLRDRGLGMTRPVLVVIDGANALRRAVTDVFDHPVIQRCQLHKLRNVADRLPDAVAKRMRAADRNPRSADGPGRPLRRCAAAALRVVEDDRPRLARAATRGKLHP
jgi:mutator family transposase